MTESALDARLKRLVFEDFLLKNKILRAAARKAGEGGDATLSLFREAVLSEMREELAGSGLPESIARIKASELGPSIERLYFARALVNDLKSSEPDVFKRLKTVLVHGSSGRGTAGNKKFRYSLARPFFLRRARKMVSLARVSQKPSDLDLLVVVDDATPKSEAAWLEERLRKLSGSKDVIVKRQSSVERLALKGKHSNIRVKLSQSVPVAGFEAARRLDELSRSASSPVDRQALWTQSLKHVLAGQALRGKNRVKAKTRTVYGFAKTSGRQGTLVETSFPFPESRAAQLALKAAFYPLLLPEKAYYAVKSAARKAMAFPVTARKRAERKNKTLKRRH